VTIVGDGGLHAELVTVAALLSPTHHFRGIEGIKLLSALTLLLEAVWLGQGRAIAIFW